MNLKPTDRLLVAGPTGAAQLRELAAQLTEGSVCVLAPAGAVGELRRELRDMTNVLIVPEDEEGTVPWADGYFTRVIAPEMTAELQRVVSPS